MSKESQLLRTVNHLYDAATDADKWPAFLESVCELFGSKLAHFCHFDYVESKLTFSFLHDVNDSPIHWLKEFEAKVNKYGSTDPVSSRARNYPGKPISCRMICDEKEIHASPLYKEVFKPRGGEYTMGVSFPDENGAQHTVLAFLRNHDQTFFDQDDCDLLGKLVPHLKRAIDLNKCLAMLDFGKNVAFEALDHIPMGIVFTDENGHIRHANKTARGIAENGGLNLNGENVSAGRPEETAQMLEIIQKGIVSARGDDILPGEAMILERPGGNPRRREVGVGLCQDGGSGTGECGELGG